MKLKFKIIFKNGKIKTYKSYNMSYEDCENKKESFIALFKQTFKENIDAHLTIKNNVIRCSDISSIKISKSL